MEAPVDRIPVEIWQSILLLTIESDGSALFTTTRTPSTFIHFLKQEEYPGSSYTGYVRRRATLRQVCRAWNHFLLSTNSWWIHLRGPKRPRRSLDLPSITDQMPTIKRLSMVITAHECIQSGIDWAFDLLQRVQVPLISYNFTFSTPFDHDFSRGPIDILAAVGPKVALGSLFQISMHLVPSHFLNSMPASRIPFLYPLSNWLCTPRKCSHFPVLSTFIYPSTLRLLLFRPKDGIFLDCSMYILGLSALQLTSIRHSISYGVMVRNSKACF